MNKQATIPRVFLRLLYACSISLIMGFGLSTATAAQNQNACGVLNTADLTVLLGGAVTAKQNSAGGCLWTATGSNRKLTAARMHASGAAAEMAFMGARQNAHSTGGKVIDESGVGEKAFSVTHSDGLIVVIMLKQGHVLQLQYQAKSAPEVKDLSELRVVAKKAAVAM